MHGLERHRAKPPAIGTNDVILVNSWTAAGLVAGLVNLGKMENGGKIEVAQRMDRPCRQPNDEALQSPSTEGAAGRHGTDR